MLEEISMEKKSNVRSQLQVPAKGISTESKKPQDVQSNGKQVPRGCRKRESPSGNGFKFDQNRKSAPQKSKTFDKRPRSRGAYYGSGKESSQINFDQLDEFGSLISPGGGSKKKNLNHLLNFHYEPRGEMVETRQHYYRPNYSTRSLMATQAHKYNKEQFLQANCQFVVLYGGDYSPYMVDPDLLVNWDLVELIRFWSNEVITCPICLYPPVAGKITRCGHVFCWPCVLHYLALSDKTWRKCPICYEAVHKGDLKSVEAIERTVCNVGQDITLQLMKRERGSLIASPVGQYEKRTQQPLLLISEEILETVYSKLLLAHYDDVLKIINREQTELNVQLKECEGCPELCFVEQAVEFLAQRRAQLEQNKISIITKPLGNLPVREESKVQEDKEENLEVSNKSASKSLASEDVLIKEKLHQENKTNTEVGLDYFEMTDNNSYEMNNEYLTEECNSEVSQINPRPRYESGSSEEEPSNITAEDLYIGTNQTNNQPIKYFYFYQAIDGQQIYLHAINVRMLEKTYGSLDQCPHSISGKIIEKEAGSMTSELRKRLRYMQHVPITCQFEVVELSLSPPIISESAIEAFEDQLEQRRKRRAKRAKEEKKREKKIAESERRMFGRGPIPDLHIESLNQFPNWDTADFPLPSSVDIPSLSQQSAEETSPTSSPSSSLAATMTNLSIDEENFDDSGPSFAQMLREGKTMRPTAVSWPAIGNSGSKTVPSASGWGNVHRQRNMSGTTDSDTESYSAPPPPKPSFSIAEAVQNAIGLDQGSSDSGVRKKKKKKQKVLFSTGMACAGK